MIDVRLRHRKGGFALDAAFRSESGALGLWGPSGSGKTSVLDALAGLTRPEEGYVRQDDRLLLDTSVRVEIPAHRRRIGYVFQEPRLFPHRSVERNLRYAHRPDSDGGPTFASVVEALELQPLLDRLPSGLSGGEARRVALGRALLSNPAWLLLDEPATGLDVGRKDRLLAHLREARRRWGLPFLVVSHAASDLLTLCDEVIALSEGRVTAQGPPTAVLFDPAAPASPPPINEWFGVVESQAAEGLTPVRVGDLRLAVEHPDPRPGAPVRLIFGADEVLLARDRADLSGLSVRNRIAVRIRSIHERPPGVLLVLECGAGQPLLAQITRQALGDLELSPGKTARALVKTSALRVE